MSEESDVLQVDAAAAADAAVVAKGSSNSSSAAAGSYATVNSILSCVCCYGLLTRYKSQQTQNPEPLEHVPCTANPEP